jgi:NAD(P)-dependent dehydrogenase (short-subunit alcohol dehydrogenase family)
MLFQAKTAVIYGGAGAIGATTAKVFRRSRNTCAAASVSLTMSAPGGRLTAAVLASPRAGAITAAVIDLSSGAIVD